MVPLVMYASRGLKIASRLFQVSLFQPIWAQLGTKLAPSWAPVGPKLAPTGLKLGPCWAQIRVPSHPRTKPSPSRPLPCCLLASQTPTRSKMDSKRASQTSNLDPKPPTWNPKYLKWTPKSCLPGPQIFLPQAPSADAQARRMRRSLFNPPPGSVASA